MPSMPSIYERAILSSKDRIVADKTLPISLFHFAKNMCSHFLKNYKGFRFKKRDLENPRSNAVGLEDIIFGFNETEGFLKIIAKEETYKAFLTAVQNKFNGQSITPAASRRIPPAKRQKIDLEGRSFDIYSEQKSADQAVSVKAPSIHTKRTFAQSQTPEASNLSLLAEAASYSRKIPQAGGFGTLFYNGQEVYSVIPYIPKHDIQPKTDYPPAAAAAIPMLK